MNSKLAIDFLGFTLLEPITFVTDTLLALVCAYFVYQISKKKILTDKEKDWKYFFLFMGVSTFLGGFSHLLYFYFGETLKVISWSISGGSIFFISKTAIAELKNEKWQKFLSVFVIVQLIVYLIALFIIRSFLVVKINSTLGMVAIVTSIHAYFYFKERRKNSGYILFGILVSAVSSATHSFKLSINELWFNYNDVSHIILIFGLYMFFLGNFRNEIQNT